MSGVRGNVGELIGRLRSVLNAVPELEGIEAAKWIASVIGGAPVKLSVIPAGVIPFAGTSDAESFVNGITVELGEYVALIGARLGYLVANGLREDFLVRSLLQEVTAKLQSPSGEAFSVALFPGELGASVAAGDPAGPEPELGHTAVSVNDRGVEDAAKRWWSACQSLLSESILQQWLHNRHHPEPPLGAA